MHYFINVCACCLKSDCFLSEYSNVNKGNCDIPNKHIQQIQTIFPDLYLNNTIPFMVCNDCLQLMYKASQIKQYLEQENNEPSQNLLLTENSCSGCLNTSTIYFSQEFYMNASKVCKKQCIDMIREALPQYKVDSCKSYKYCRFCSNSIKSLYLLKSLITRKNFRYEKYCFTMLRNKHFQSRKFSQLSINLQKTTSTQNNSIGFKIENDGLNYDALTNTQQNYSFYEKSLIKEEICIKDEYTNENDYFQGSSSSESTFNSKHQISTVLGNDQIEIDVKSYSSKSCSVKRVINEDKSTKSFIQKIHLIVHERIHTGEKPYRCNYCTKSFTLRGNLTVHEKSHTGEKPYRCNYCTKSFTRRYTLVVHERAHSGEEPYECRRCNKSFTTSTALKRHNRIHTGEKPYRCNYCTKSFTRRYTLVVHERAHSGEEPYECRHCNKSFTTSTALKRHNRIHTGEKPYKCKYCTKSFAQRMQLIVHVRTHSGEKPYKCKYCKKVFAIKGNLKVHERFHTGEKLHKCKECAKSFYLRIHLKTHEKTHC